MFFKRSFKNRITIIFLVVVIIPLTFLGLITYRNIYKYLISQQNQKTLERIINDTNLLNSSFDSKINILQSLSLSLGYQIMDSKDEVYISRYLEQQKRTIGQGFSVIYVTDEAGKMYDANFWYENFRHIDFREMEWYQGPKTTKGIYFCNPYQDIATNHNIITISMPIYDKKGEFLGVLGADYLMENIIHQINNINMSHDTFHIIIDDDNNVVYSQDRLNSIDYKKFIQEPQKLVEMECSEKKIIGTYTRLDSINMGVITFQDIQDHYKYINEIKYFFIFIYIMMIMLIVFSIMYISEKLARPVMQLKQGVRRIVDGDYDTSLPIPNDEDFAELVESFNSMAITIKDSYESLSTQSMDLTLKNQLLQETYTELEQSYGRLQSTTEQLNYSEIKYRTLIENISDLIWVLDEKGKITYINRRVKEILGYEREEVLGKHISTIMSSVHEYEDYEDIINQFYEKDTKSIDLWLLKADGEEKIVLSSSVNRIFNNDKIVAIQGIGRDVTEKIRLQDKILRKNKELVTLNSISNILNSRIEMDDLLRTVVDKIHELLKTEICSIRLLDGDWLKLKAISGKLKKHIYKDSINIHKAIVGRAVLEKKSIFLRNVKESDVYYNDKIFKLNQNLAKLLFIPLILDNETIGVLSVGFLREVDEVEIEILKAFSNHAAIAIEKAKLYQDLKDSYVKTIRTLATAVEAKDSYTEGHSTRVARYSTLIATQLGLEQKEIEEIYISGILHDIGKIGIDDAILTKPGRLTEEEYLAITKHPAIGQKILSHIGLPESILNGVLLHHKRYDLLGYPKDVQVDVLPIEACIIGAADAFDAITTNRSYSSARSMEDAIKELQNNKGTQFCPKIVDALEQVYVNNKEEIKEIINSSNID